MPTTADPGSPRPRRLCIFAKAPVAGRVKRRLIPALGEAGALAAHTELLAGTLERCVRPAAYESVLWLAGGDAQQPPISDWLRRFRLPACPQTGRDLGERMSRALEVSLADGALAVLIGSDCPQIDHRYVAGAFEALSSHDLVLGPAEDGGYGLVGVRVAQPDLFTDMVWGAADVLATTLERARRAGLRTVCLPEIFDVDRPEDWWRYRSLRIAPGKGIE